MKRAITTVALIGLGACGGAAGTDAGMEGDAGSNRDASVMLDAGALDAGFDGGIPLNYAFVTSIPSTGALGGVEGAHQRCNDAADAAGLAGTFVAWISTADYDAIDGIGEASGWMRPDGRVFARSRADLLAGNIVYPLRIDENGDDVLDVAPTAWTSTDPDGTHTATYGGNTCLDWTSGTLAGGPVHPGRTFRTANFATTGTGQCNELLRLFCFGTDHIAPLPTLPIVEGRRAFVTHAEFIPGGGLAMADALCQSEADAAGLVDDGADHSGQFRAALATVGTTMASRFELTGAPWVRLDGARIAPTAAALFTLGGLLETAVNVEADGTYSNRGLWTGTGGMNDITEAGTVETTCDGWSVPNDTGTGRLGVPYSSSLSEIAGDYDGPCNSSAGLLCLER